VPTATLLTSLKAPAIIRTKNKQDTTTSITEAEMKTLLIVEVPNEDAV
jgi:hypothetical protein